MSNEEGKEGGTKKEGSGEGREGEREEGLRAGGLRAGGPHSRYSHVHGRNVGSGPERSVFPDEAGFCHLLPFFSFAVTHLRLSSWITDHVGLQDAHGDARGMLMEMPTEMPVSLGPLDPIARGPDPSNYYS